MLMWIRVGYVKTNCCTCCVDCWFYDCGQGRCGLRSLMRRQRTARRHLVCRSLVSDARADMLSWKLAVDPGLPPSALIADVVKRSPVAHLFYFYPVLCEIASIPRKTPVAWVSVASPPVGSASRDPGESKGSQGRIGAPEGDGKVVEVDARALAKECLRVLGKEMGAV